MHVRFYDVACGHFVHIPASDCYKRAEHGRRGTLYAVYGRKSGKQYRRYTNASAWYALAVAEVQ